MDRKIDDPNVGWNFVLRHGLRELVWIHGEGCAHRDCDSVLFNAMK